MLLLDTAPWVALLSRNDKHQRWAVEQFRLLPPPFLSCEAVRGRCDWLFAGAFRFCPVIGFAIDRPRSCQLPFVLHEQIGAISSLFKRYKMFPFHLLTLH
jgi:hypothetical protein